MSRSEDDDDWVGTPPEGHHSRDRAKPEFWRGQLPGSLIAGMVALTLIIILIVALLH